MTFFVPGQSPKLCPNSCASVELPTCSTILNGTCSVLTEHQATDAVLRSVATTIIKLHVVLWVVRIVDTRQALIVIIVGDELAFLGKVGSLLGQHIAKRIVSEAGDAACRMAHLSTAVTHVVSRGGNIALRVGDTNKTLHAVYLNLVDGKWFKDIGRIIL